MAPLQYDVVAILNAFLNLWPKIRAYYSQTTVQILVGTCGRGMDYVDI